MRQRIAALPLFAAMMACRSTSPTATYPDASFVEWVQPDSLPTNRPLVLSDGARIEYIGSREELSWTAQMGCLRCIERTGEPRWSITESPASRENALPPSDAHPLAGAFYRDDEDDPAPVGLQWNATTLLADVTHLYVVQYYPYSTGASVVAIDVKNGRQVWGRKVQGIGTVPHSRYSNSVAARMIGSALAIFGAEAAGAYIEVLSPSGEMLSTRIVRMPRASG